MEQLKNDNTSLIKTTFDTVKHFFHHKEKQQVVKVKTNIEKIDNGNLPVQDGDALVTYTNASMLKTTNEEQKKLQQPVDENIVEIRPDGLLYLPQVFVRNILNQVFGIGQWALLQHKINHDQEHNKLYFDGSLFVRGSFVARAMGEAEYHLDNPMQSWASVYESSKSDCLVRCCKDLGIAKELWMPAFGRNWQKKFAVKVWREKTGGKGGKVGSYQWRRQDVDKFYDEKGTPLSMESSEQHVFDVESAQKNTMQSEIQMQSMKEFDPAVEIISFGKHSKEKSEDGIGKVWAELPMDYLEWIAKSEKSTSDSKAKAIATIEYKKAIHKQIPDVMDKAFGKKESVAIINTVFEPPPDILMPIEKLQISLDEVTRKGDLEGLEGWTEINKTELAKLSDSEKTEMRKAYNAAKKLLKGSTK